jgi:hypothetical protein
MATHEYTLEITHAALLVVRPNNEVAFRLKPDDSKYAIEIVRRLNLALRSRRR